MFRKILGKSNTKIFMERKALLGHVHPSLQLFFTLMLALFVAMIVVFVGFLLGAIFMDKSLLQLMEGLDFTSAENVAFGKYMQIISHLGMFIIPSLLLAYFFRLQIQRYLFLDRLPRLGLVVLSGLLVVVSIPFIHFVLEYNMQMHLPESLRGLENWMRRAEENAEALTRTFLGVDTLTGLMFNIFMIAIIPAIGEELMFRGVLMRIFWRWTSNKHAAVWITAIIFSAIHLQFFGFFPRMLLGVMFGYMVVWTGSLWPAMIAHFVNNTMAVVFFYLMENKIINVTYENFGQEATYTPLLYASVLLVAVIMWRIFQKYSAKPDW